MAMTLLRQGRLIPVPPVEKAMRVPGRAAADAAARRAAHDRRLARDACARGLEDVAAEYGAEEVMIVTITHDHAPAGAPTS